MAFSLGNSMKPHTSGCSRISEARLPGLLVLDGNGSNYSREWQHPPTLWHSLLVCTTISLLRHAVFMRQPTTKSSGVSMGSQRRDHPSTSDSRSLLKIGPLYSTACVFLNFKGCTQIWGSYLIRLQAWDGCGLSMSWMPGSTPNQWDGTLSSPPL